MIFNIPHGIKDDARIKVEIAYALPEQQVIIALKVVPGTTAETAVIASGIINKFPEIDLAKSRIGIFGKPAKLDTVLQHMDRVEIYRPLIADPKQIRKQRAAATGTVIKQRK